VTREEAKQLIERLKAAEDTLTDIIIVLHKTFDIPFKDVMKPSEILTQIAENISDEEPSNDITHAFDYVIDYLKEHSEYDKQP
jgi:uncharacterized membrane protein